MTVAINFRTRCSREIRIFFKKLSFLGHYKSYFYGILLPMTCIYVWHVFSCSYHVSSAMRPLASHNPLLLQWGIQDINMKRLSAFSRVNFVKSWRNNLAMPSVNPKCWFWLVYCLLLYWINLLCGKWNWIIKNLSETGFSKAGNIKLG